MDLTDDAAPPVDEAPPEEAAGTEADPGQEAFDPESYFGFYGTEKANEETEEKPAGEGAEPSTETVETPPRDPSEPGKESGADGGEGTAEPKLYLDRYKTADELADAHVRLEQQTQALWHERQQVQSQLQQAQAELAKAQAFKSLPAQAPNFEAIAAQDPQLAQQLAYQAALQGLDPQTMLGLEWRLRKERLEQETAQTQAQQEYYAVEHERASQNVWRYAQELMPDGQPHAQTKDVIASLLRGQPPEAVETMGRALVQLVANTQQLRRLEAEVSAKVDAARKAGREEARQVRESKTAARTVASRTKTTAERAYVPADKPSKEQSTADFIDQLLKM